MDKLSVQFSSVQLLSCVWLFATTWIAASQGYLSITKSWSSLKLRSIESVMPSSHLILCRPLLFLPPVPPSIRDKLYSQQKHDQELTMSQIINSLLPNSD